MLKRKISFYQWMLENWAIHGGLLAQATAARMMNITKARVTQMIKEGKLQEFRYEKQVFVSYAETMKYAREKEYKKMESEIIKELEKLSSKIPQEQLQELQNGTNEIIKMCNNIINEDKDL